MSFAIAALVSEKSMMRVSLPKRPWTIIASTTLLGSALMLLLSKVLVTPPE
jgi:hypothetical protein